MSFAWVLKQVAENSYGGVYSPTNPTNNDRRVVHFRGLLFTLRTSSGTFLFRTSRASRAWSSGHLFSDVRNVSGVSLGALFFTRRSSLVGFVGPYTPPYEFLATCFKTQAKITFQFSAFFQLFSNVGSQKLCFQLEIIAKC